MGVRGLLVYFVFQDYVFGGVLFLVGYFLSSFSANSKGEWKVEEVLTNLPPMDTLPPHPHPTSLE